ncbi:MAG: porphobilinogen synthase [Deltaproteobacteria bacterium]|nr:porphobilinogen synthase [Deltaproteobacteria bacterium]
MIQRPRRLRQNRSLREMVRETEILPRHLIQPLFIKEGTEKRPIPSMPGLFQWPLALVAREAAEIYKTGIRSVLLFGIPAKKDKKASGAYALDGIVQQAVAVIKEKIPELQVITDVCLCEYMDHGHCGLVNAKGEIENDSSLELITRTAVSHAEAGADIVAPSDMMDGRVAAIRSVVDIPIMSYAVKYASSFYGPFREAAMSAPAFGDRKTYQMDFANVREALREAALDEKEGADFLIVKPALPYLDIITKVSAQTSLPVVGYQVSGEYAQIVAAAQNGWLDKKQAVFESLTAIRRAGARLVITYFAKEFCAI